MTKPILNCSRIVPRIGQGISRRRAGACGMHREIEASALANAFNVPVNRIGREWSAAFGRRIRSLSPGIAGVAHVMP